MMSSYGTPYRWYLPPRVTLFHILMRKTTIYERATPSHLRSLELNQSNQLKWVHLVNCNVSRSKTKETRLDFPESKTDLTFFCFSLFLLKTEQGTSHDFDRPGDAMYDIYHWWVQNPDSWGGKKSYGFSVVMGGVVGPLNKSWDWKVNILEKKNRRKREKIYESVPCALENNC